MASNKKPTPSGKGRLSTLYVSLTGVEVGYVPKRWVKALIGAFLLIPSWILSRTFFSLLVQSASEVAFWKNQTFWVFALSLFSGVFLFFTAKFLIWGYVIGHEMTHVLWAWIYGGDIYDFRVARSGGHIVTDKTNTWVVLAPYFFPFYTVLWLSACGVVWLVARDFQIDSQIIYGGIGITWAFHMAYTIWMIVKGQPDLEYGGVFFSLVIIYFINLGLICGLLVVASPGVSWLDFFRELLENTMEFSVFAEQVARKLLIYWNNRALG